MVALLLPLLAGCDQQLGAFAKPPGDTADDSGTWHPGDTDTDTADTDGDLDDDGVTPEEGDCDDTDFRIGPGLPEREDNGKDDDCDGRIDEAWDGVAVAYVSGDGAGQILELSHSGKVADTIDTDEECAPTFISYLPDGSGWLANNGFTKVVTVDRSGTCTELADFSETDFGVYGITIGLDGTFYATTVDSLVTIAADGTVTTLAAWDPDTQMLAVGLATDPLTGQIGVFDYLGGFATYDEVNGFVIQIQADFANPALTTFSGAHRDGGSWYVPAQDLHTGLFGIYGYDAAAKAWVKSDEWHDEDWTPFMLTVDGDDANHPDYYVTATAGWYQTVWRIAGGTNTALDFYVSSGSEPGTFYGIASHD